MPRGEQPGVRHGLELRGAGRERGIVAREGVPTVLYDEVVLSEPGGYLAAGRASVRLEPRRLFRHGATLVVEQAGRWRSAETAEVIGSQTVATGFVVSDELVRSVVRYDDLSEALKSAGLDHSDEMPS